MKILKVVATSVTIGAMVFVAACSVSPETRRARFMADGDRFMRQKDYARAVLQFRNAASLNPSDPSPFYQMGLAHFYQNDIGAAVADFKQAAKLNPKHAAAQLKLAQLLMFSENRETLEDAMARLKIVLETAGESGESLNALALTEMRLGNAADGERYLQHALEAFPQSLDAYVSLVRLRIAQKNLPAAIEVIQRAIAADPKAVQPVIVLSRLYLGKGDLPAAESQLEKALRMDPANLDAQLDHAVLLHLRGREDEASQELKKLSASPDHIYSSAYGLYLSERGHLSEAIAEFERLLKADPTDRTLRSRLLATYHAMGRDVDAEKLLDQAIQKDPKDFDAMMQLAEIYIATGRQSQAEQSLNTVLRFRPTSADVHYTMAQFHRARHSLLAYRQELAEAVRLSPRLLKARLELARLLTFQTGGVSALQVLNEAPQPQDRQIEVLIEKTWALLQMGEFLPARRNVTLGLSVSREPELLLQDAALKFYDKDFKGSGAAFKEVMKRTPNDVRALAGLTQVYTAQGQKGTVADDLEKHATENPNSAAIQEFVGEWMSKNGHEKSARQYLEAAKHVDPQFQSADLAMARLDLQQGKFEEAGKSIESAKKAGGENVEFLINAASVAIAQGKFSDAVELYQKALTIDANQLVALNNASYLLTTALNKPDLALQYAQRAKELSPNNPAIDDTIGWAYYSKGMYTSAITHLEGAAKSKADAIFQYHLGFAQIKGGNAESGKKVLEAALTAAPTLPEAQLAHQMLQSR